MQVVSLDSIQDFTSNVPIVPDSFDEPHVDASGSGPIISSHKEACPAHIPKIPIVKEHVAILNANLSVPALDTIESIKPSSHDVSTILEENNQDGCVKKCLSIPHCTSSTNMILSQETVELCGAKGNLMQTGHRSENKEAKSKFCSTEGSKLNLSPFASTPRMLYMIVSVIC